LSILDEYCTARVNRKQVLHVRYQFALLSLKAIGFT
jgi:hypothetical protein